MKRLRMSFKKMFSVFCSAVLFSSSLLPYSSSRLFAQGEPIEEEGPIKEEAPKTLAPAERPAPAPAVEVSPMETRITVRVKNAPLSTFLDTISAQANVNFIASQEVEGQQITAFLQNATVREALQVLLEIKGLTYRRIGRSNTYVVSRRSVEAPNVITRIYTLNYIPLIPIGSVEQEQSSIASQSVGTTFSFSGMGTTGAGAGGGAAPPAAAGGAGEVAIISVIQSLLSPKTGQVSVDARTNSLIVTDIPETFPLVEQIIAELDKKASQVLIEAQIVEINSDKAQEMGLEWGGARGELAVFTGPKRPTDFPLRPGQFSGGRQSDFFPPPSQFVDTPGTPPRGITYGVLDLSQLSVILRALITKEEARFLGKPKIMTLNNKTAIIQIARDQAVSVQTSLVQGSGGTSISGATVERRSTGLVLKVTPQVNKEGFITVLIQPSFTDVVPSAVAPAVFDTISRGASSLIRVKNGQTIALGGLLQSKEDKLVRKVPLLGYIPILGWLFTSVSNVRRNTDLVIFITPTVVND